MNKKNPYSFFDSYLLRTPTISFNRYLEITSHKNISDEAFKELFKNKKIKESILIATPTLYKEINKWVNGDDLDIKKKNKIKSTLFKYFTRMTTRCTPFGTFSGFSLGSISDSTNIEPNNSLNKVFVRLDFLVLVKLYHKLNKEDFIISQLKLYPNSTIYQINNEYRYTEYSYSGTLREYKISSVEYSTYLSKVLKASKNGVYIKELITTLTTDFETSESEANSYIKLLIDSQILVSELEPSLTGIDYLEKLILIMDGLQDVDKYLKALKNIQEYLSIIHNKAIINNDDFFTIKSLIEENFNIQVDIKNLLQIDLMLGVNENKLDKKLISKVRKAIHLLNYFSLGYQNKRLENFAKNFQERFEDKEVPLVIALDQDTGIQYNEISKKNKKSSIHFSHLDEYLFKKILNAKIDHKEIIDISLDDLKELDIIWNDLPNTINCMVEILKDNSEVKYRIKTIAGHSSAINLINRFGSVDEKIKNFMTEVSNLEIEMDKNKLIAEVVHLPNDRLGNVLRAPELRNYEIPILAKSSKRKENQIDINDLMISIVNNNLKLRSKRLNKEISPKISNAYNYNLNCIPIYLFLADFQKYNQKNTLIFHLSKIFENFEFIPRIQFENIIIYPATWYFDTKDIPLLQKKNVLKNELISNILNFKKNNKLPDFISFIEDENEFLINFNNNNSVMLFSDLVKRSTKFILKEFLYQSDDFIVKNNEESFTNEFVFSLHKKKQL